MCACGFISIHVQAGKQRQDGLRPAGRPRCRARARRRVRHAPQSDSRQTARPTCCAAAQLDSQPARLRVGASRVCRGASPRQTRCWQCSTNKCLIKKSGSRESESQRQGEREKRKREFLDPMIGLRTCEGGITVDVYIYIYVAIARLRSRSAAVRHWRDRSLSAYARDLGSDQLWWLVMKFVVSPRRLTDTGNAALVLLLFGVFSLSRIRFLFRSLRFRLYMHTLSHTLHSRAFSLSPSNMHVPTTTKAVSELGLLTISTECRQHLACWIAASEYTACQAPGTV